MPRLRVGVVADDVIWTTRLSQAVRPISEVLKHTSPSCVPSAPKAVPV
jgi:hypothetical protein